MQSTIPDLTTPARPMDDPRPDDEPASKRLNDLLATDDARAAAPSRPPAFRGDDAFRDDRFEDPRDRATYGTSLADEIHEGERPLAERGTRLVAQLLDGLAGIVIVVPAIIGAVLGAVLGGILGIDEATGVGAVLGGIGGAIALVVYQLRLLAAEGQTIGKRAMKIRIVDVEDGSNPGITRSFWVRGFVNGIIASVPYLGTLYAIADIGFIFRDDRRCIHDHLAKTVVVKDVG